MNLRNRVLSAFAFKEVHPVPYTIWYDEDVARRLASHYNDSNWAARIKNHLFRMTVEWEPREYTGETIYKDLHGTEWKAGNPPHILTPALKQPDLKDFRIPSYLPYLKNEPTGRHGVVGGSLPALPYGQARERLKTEKEEVFTVIGYGEGIFTRAWMIRGYENFLSDLLLEPAFANELLDLLLERQLELLDPLLELPCDAIIFSDDWGDQRGVIVGPELWRRFIKLRARLLYEKVHQAGKMTFQHTCGNVFEIIPDMIEIGLDCLQSLQAEAMSVYEIKKQYGRELRLWGGLGTQKLLPFGTPAEIRTEVRRLKKELGRNGGYVFTSSKPISNEVPTENAVAFIEEAIKNE